MGWSLDALAARCHMSASSLSRIETGHRRISLDQLTSIARALGATLDQLVESGSDEDVVIRPRHDAARGLTMWPVKNGPGVTVAKMRVSAAPGELKAHPGWDWAMVLSGTLVLLLGERTILVNAGEAVEFSTMIPHAFGAHGGPAELLGIFDRDGRSTHLRADVPAALAEVATAEDDVT